MGERSRATTIADVAAHAGVSQASVSRVLNGKQSVDVAADPRLVTRRAPRPGNRFLSVTTELPGAADVA